MEDKKGISIWVFVIPLFLAVVLITAVFSYRFLKDGYQSLTPELERTWIGKIPTPAGGHYNEPNVYIIPSGMPDAERLGTVKELQDLSKDDGSNDFTGIYATANAL